MTTDLGTNQRAVLDLMRKHRGRWHRGCGWSWGSASETTSILMRLEARGLVTRSTFTYKTADGPQVVPEWRLPKEG